MQTWPVNGIDLAVLAEGAGSARRARPRVPRPRADLAAAGAGAGRRRLPGGGPRHAGVRRQLAPRAGGGLPQRRARQRPGRAAGPRERAARPLRRARLGCLERVAARTDAPRPGAVADRSERPLRAAGARAADRDLPASAGRGLLHAPLPPRRRDPPARARRRPHAGPGPERTPGRPGTGRPGPDDLGTGVAVDPRRGSPATSSRRTSPPSRAPGSPPPCATTATSTRTGAPRPSKGPPRSRRRRCS